MRLEAAVGRAALAMCLIGMGGAAAAGKEDARVALGQRAYNQNCRVCHQADAIGKPGFAPSLTNPEFLGAASDKFLATTIRDGRPGTAMPPFAHLGRKQVMAIVAFLRSHSSAANRSGAVDAEENAAGDPGAGDHLFHSICSACHGDKGDGYLAGGTGTAIGKSGFLDKASDGFIRETIRKGLSGTRMRGFSGPEGLANLSDQDVDDVIVYLRSLSGRQSTQ